MSHLALLLVVASEPSFTEMVRRYLARLTVAPRPGAGGTGGGTDRHALRATSRLTPHSSSISDPETRGPKE